MNLEGPIAWFCRNGVAANLLMFSILAAGTYSLFFRIPIEVFPQSDPETISITVPYRGATPKEVEKGVAILVEEALDGLEGIDRLRSESSENRCSILIELENGYNPRNLLDDIKNRVDAINNFPREVERPIINLAQRTRSVISIIATGDLSEMEMRRVGEQLRDDLLSIEGITQVRLRGVRPYEISIEVDEETLQSYGLKLNDVANAVRHFSLDLAAGSIRTSGGDVLIRTPGQAYTADEFAALPLRMTPDGGRLTVGDVAKIRDGFEENELYVRYKKSHEEKAKAAISIAIDRTGAQNAFDVTRKVKDYIKETKHTLPHGVEVHYWNDRSRGLYLRARSLTTSLVFALLIVGCILALFLDVRLAFWVCVGIPVCFAGTWIVMPYIDGTLNLISLFAFILVLGIVVDDAIVTGENIYSKRETIKDPTEAAIIGTKEIARPVTFGILTTVAAFAPLAFVPGPIGNFIRQLPLVIVPVLLFSLVESKLILPSHLKHMRLRFHDPDYRPGVFARWKQRFMRGFDAFVERLYRPTLDVALRWRYVTLSVFLATGVVLVSWATTRLPQTMLPRIPSERITMTLQMPVGTPFEVTERHVLRIASVAEAMQADPAYTDNVVGPIIESIMVTVGSASRSSRSGGSSHLGEVVMEVLEPEKRTLKVSSFDLVAEWRQRIGAIPGSRELSFRAQFGRQRSPVDIQLTGPSFDDLAAAEVEVRDLLGTYEGLFDITTTFEEGKEEIQLALKPEAQQLGITLEDLARQTRRAFFGEEAQRIQRGRDDLRVMVRYPRADRESLHALENMYIRTTDGTEVPFSTVAEARVGTGYTTIRRIDRARALAVLAEADKDETDVVAILEDLDRELPFIVGKYRNMRYTFEGEARDSRETSASLRWAIGGVLFLIYALLAVPFRSYAQPLIVMLVIPFGVIGALLGHMIMGIKTLSIMSQYGMLALLGVVVNDSLVLVDYVNVRRMEGMPLDEAVRRAGRVRFRPILLTSLTTFGGLLPTMFEKSTQAQFLIPMAVSLGYGILFATFITLLLVPANYLILEDIKSGFTRLWRWYTNPFRRRPESAAGNPTSPTP